jgi:hypothetical protein
MFRAEIVRIRPPILMAPINDDDQSGPHGLPESNGGLMTFEAVNHI